VLVLSYFQVGHSYSSRKNSYIRLETMELEKMDPLQALVHSVTKQQQNRSDLVNRLSYLTAHLSKRNDELASLVSDEQLMRRQLVDIIRSNALLREANSTTVKNCEIEHQNRSSLALTLDSLNEKKNSLEDTVKSKKDKYEEMTNELRNILEVDGSSLAQLFEEPGNSS
jgi:chromosome segregation ATPase